MKILYVVSCSLWQISRLKTPIHLPPNQRFGRSLLGREIKAGIKKIFRNSAKQ